MGISLYTIIVVICFLFILAYLSYLGFQNTKNAQDYLVAGRKIHPLVMALSYGATFISTSAIIGFGGLAATMGLGLLWLTFFNIFLGIFIAFIFFGKRTRKMGHLLDAHTFPEFLGRRFESRFVQGFAGILIFIGMPIYTASIIKGGANFIESYFSIPYTTSLLFFVAIVAIYVWVGGLKGVMYTDAFQGLVMFIAMIFLLIFTYANLGGVVTAHKQLTELFSNPAVQESIANSIKGGFQGWTSMPAGGSPIWWALVSTIVAGVGIGVLAQPQLVVRFMTVKSDRELNRAVFSGGLFILAMTGIAFVVGALTNVIFFNDTNQIAIAAAGGVNDKIIPSFITNYLPAWFTPIFLVSMLAAAMSTLSSQFHAMGTAAGRDLYEQTLRKKGNTMLITKSGMLVSIILSTAIAWGTMNLPVFEGIIAKFTSVFFELASATFLPAYIGALYFKKMPKKAAIGGMIAGATTWFLWVFFVHDNAAFFQICNILFGKTSIVAGTSLASLSHVGTTFIALPVSLIVTALIWLFNKKETGLSEEHLDKCFPAQK